MLLLGLLLLPVLLLVLMLLMLLLLLLLVTLPLMLLVLLLYGSKPRRCLPRLVRSHDWNVEGPMTEKTAEDRTLRRNPHGEGK